VAINRDCTRAAGLAGDAFAVNFLGCAGVVDNCAGSSEARNSVIASTAAYFGSGSENYFVGGVSESADFGHKCASSTSTANLPVIDRSEALARLHSEDYSETEAGDNDLE
jgi:hypothetical protein